MTTIRYDTRCYFNVSKADMSQPPYQIVDRSLNLAVLLTHCGQLIIRKISKFDANRCQILRVKCTKFDLRWGSAPDPIAVFMGSYF